MTIKSNQMKHDQSLLKKEKKKIHCVIWNALFFTNVIDHWLQTSVCSKRKSAKCPLKHLFTVFKVPFLQQEKKKGVAEARNWFIVCFS